MNRISDEQPPRMSDEEKPGLTKAPLKHHKNVYFVPPGTKETSCSAMRSGFRVGAFFSALGLFAIARFGGGYKANRTHELSIVDGHTKLALVVRLLAARGTIAMVERNIELKFVPCPFRG